MAVLSVRDAPPAAAQSSGNAVWSATLTVGDVLTGLIHGCQQPNIRNEDVLCSTALTDDDFTYDGTNYRVIGVQVQGSRFRLVLDPPPPSNWDALYVKVSGKTFTPKTAMRSALVVTGDSMTWGSSGLSWAVGDTVQVKLVERALPTLDLLPGAGSVDPVPPSQRRPSGEGASASDAFCYLGEGNGTTEYVRYPDGRIVETTRQSDAIRSMFACN